MKGVMGIRLGIFDHDSLTFWRTPPKVCAGGEHFIYNSTRVFRCNKIEIEISLHGLNAANSLHASKLDLDQFGNFLGPLRHRNFLPFACPRFIRRGLEE